MVFPVAKLGYLAFKQVSKPLANFIKARAKTSPIFRKYFCAYPAQVYHRFDTNIRMRLLGLKHAEKVKPLTEEMAVELGAEMLGELVIFSAAGAVLYLESARSSAKEQAKDDAVSARIDDLQGDVKELGLIIERQGAELREMTRLVHSLRDNTVSGQLSKVIDRHLVKKDAVDSVDIVVEGEDKLNLASPDKISYRHKLDDGYELYTEGLMLIAACVLVCLKLFQG